MFTIPIKPNIELKEKAPDKRHYCVVPIRVCTDKNLTRRELMALLLIAGYASNNGFTTVALSTLARDWQVSVPYICTLIKRLERKGYIKSIRKGYTGIRGALRRIIYDDSLTDQDAISISNTPITIESDITMARPKKVTLNSKGDKNTLLTYDDAVLVVSQFLNTEADMLKLERLVSQGVSHSQLINAFNEGA